MLWLIFAVVALLILASWLLTRSEDVGSIVCPFETQVGGSRARVTIARQGDAAWPMVHLRVRITGGNLAFAMEAGQAKELATLLESAAARLRGP